MWNLLGFLTLVTLLFAFEAHWALWLILAFFVVCFLIGFFGDVEIETYKGPEPKLKKTLFGRYTEQQWKDAFPYSPGHRRINPNTGKPWWDD